MDIFQEQKAHVMERNGYTHEARLSPRHIQHRGVGDRLSGRRRALGEDLLPEVGQVSI